GHGREEDAAEEHARARVRALERRVGRAEKPRVGARALVRGPEPVALVLLVPYLPGDHLAGEAARVVGGGRPRVARELAGIVRGERARGAELKRRQAILPDGGALGEPAEGGVVGMAVAQDPYDPEPGVLDRPHLAVALGEVVVVQRLARGLDLPPVDVEPDRAHARHVEPAVVRRSLGERVAGNEVRVRRDEAVRRGARRGWSGGGGAGRRGRQGGTDRERGEEPPAWHPGEGRPPAARPRRFGLGRALQGLQVLLARRAGAREERRRSRHPRPDPALEVAAHPGRDGIRAAVGVEAPEVQAQASRPLPEVGIVHVPLVTVDRVHEGEEGLLPALAGDQGGEEAFFAFVDSIYGDQGHVDDPHLWERARGLSLDLGRFDADRRSDAVAARVRRDFESGIRAGVARTPAFFAGARPASEEDLEALERST